MLGQGLLASFKSAVAACWSRRAGLSLIFSHAAASMPGNVARREALRPRLASLRWAGGEPADRGLRDRASRYS